MQFLIDLFLSILPYIRTIFLAIIPLGFIIFIHELGHFYAAKRCGIKVNTFSLGFGPRLIGFVRGETEYRISALPFGGYVQLEGENPNEQTGAAGEFASASIGERAFVVAAGPAVNLIFGVLVYWLIFATGINADSARLIGGLTGQTLGQKEPIQIGGLAAEGAGARGGLLPGDTILAVNGDAITHWAVFHTRILTSPDKELEILVERKGDHQTLYVTPEAVPSVRGDIGIIKVSAKDRTVVRDVADGSLAAQAGLQVGDIVETINGEPIHNVPYFGYGIWHPSADWSARKRQALYERINENEQSVTLGIRRGDTTQTLEMPVHWRVMASVQENSIAQDAGIQNGDVLATLNGEPVDNTTLYSQLDTRTHTPIVLNLIRDGNLIAVTLEGASPMTDPDAPPFGLAWQTALSGIQFMAKTPPLPEYDALSALGKGIEATWLTFTTVGRTLQQLIGGEVSPKHLAGPIGIANATSRMFERVGLSSVLFFIGFISINLCIVNLLPIPIADGGQLLFFAFEKVRGKPMPRKAQEIVQQVSIALLIALFLYITWFDGISLIHDIRN